MSLDSKLRPEDENFAVEVNKPSVDPNYSSFSASIIGHGCFAGLGFIAGSFYGLETWKNGGGNGDLLSGMYYGALIAGLFSITFLKYEWKK